MPWSPIYDEEELLLKARKKYVEHVERTVALATASVEIPAPIMIKPFVPPAEAWWGRAMVEISARATRIPKAARWTVYLADAIQRCELCFHRSRYCFCHTCKSCREKLVEETTCARCKSCVKCCECDRCSKCQKKAEICKICERCEPCCECRHCMQCKRPFSDDDMCVCGNCVDCCHCAYCNSCDNRVTTLCPRCDYCDACCECREHEQVRFFVNEPVFHEAKATELKENPSKRLLSAEIEVAGVKKNGKAVEEVIKKWRGSIVHDGSLPTYGFEINTAPASGDKFVQEITDIGEALKQVEAFVTPECGLHVHIDARKFDYYDIRRLILAYSTVEPVLFQMVSPSRRNSEYCRMCANKYLQSVKKGKLTADEVRMQVQKAIYGMTLSQGDERDMKRSKHNGFRYAAMNLHSWMYRGTVECRLFGGTVKPEKIIPWSRLWATMLDYVASHPDEEVDALVGKPRENMSKILSVDEALDRFVSERIEFVESETKKGHDIDTETA